MVIVVIARIIKPRPDYQGSRDDTKGDDQNLKLYTVCHILKTKCLNSEIPWRVVMITSPRSKYMIFGYQPRRAERPRAKT